jgi:hypothetical protein
VSRTVLFLQAEPVDRFDATGRKLPGTTARVGENRVGENRVDAPRRVPACVGQRGT